MIATGGTAAIAAGCTHALALGSDGNVWGWGDNATGQLGLAGGGVRPVRVQVPGLSSIKSIAAGCGWSMALDSSGGVWSWGSNTSGQLGDGTTTSRHTPALVANVSGVARIAAGHSHALAVVSGGAVRSWGANGSGQLGNNSSGGISTVPVNVANQAGTANLTGVTSVAAGTAHSVANTSSGVLAWGAAEHFQLGNASTVPRSLPVAVQADGSTAPLTGVVAIIAGGNSTAAVTSGGQVKQAGSHFDGTNCQTALDMPGTGPTTFPVPGPRPTSRAPNPACQNQVPTPPGAYGLVDGVGRATFAGRALNSTSIAAPGTRPKPTHTPVGFQTGQGQDRSHLLAHIFGGPTKDGELHVEENIVALFAQTNQQPLGMRRYELEIQTRLVEACETITFLATPKYDGPNPCDPQGINCAPTSVRLDADGTGPTPYSLHCTIPNPPNGFICPGH